MKEKLRNQMQGLSEPERESLRSEMNALSIFNKEEFEAWGTAFRQIFEVSGLQMPKSLAGFPQPPKEPDGAWEELSRRAKLDGNGRRRCFVDVAHVRLCQSMERVSE